MGCCNNDKCSATSAEKPKRRIPWFALLLSALVLLVIVNWQ